MVAVDVNIGSAPVADPQLETAAYYKTTALKLIQHASGEHTPTPPWHGIPPALEEYRRLGHRRLNADTYSAKCSDCIWGSQTAVEMIIGQWNPQQRRYRTDTFCYDLKSRQFHRAGPTRKMPGLRRMSWEEKDWADEEATVHRTMDE